MSTKTSSTAIYAIILTIGALFIPLQFSFAQTYHLQGVVGHVCDQSMSTIHAGGCSTGGSYRAVEDEQQTTSNGNSNSSGAFAGYAGICSDRRHCPSAASTP
jgi:hypothetical protein